MTTVLLANDDGFHAVGLQTLAERLSRDYDVFIVAPDRERSATSHALTLHRPIRVDEMSVNYPVKGAYSITGTPSDCVKMAITTLMEEVKPDIVVSGINHGPNLGSDVLYSGTVSAAMEGSLLGFPSIAVSLMNGGEKIADFTPSSDFIARYIPVALSANLPEQTLLNINVPGLAYNEFAGVQLTYLGKRMYNDNYEKRVDPRGLVYYWLAGELIQYTDEMDSDVGAVQHNMISITPIHYDMTIRSVLENYRPQLEITL